MCHWLVIASDANMNLTSNLILMLWTAFMSHICYLICMSHHCLPPENNALLCNDFFYNYSTLLLWGLSSIMLFFSLLEQVPAWMHSLSVLPCTCTFIKKTSPAAAFSFLILKYLVKFRSATDTSCLLSPLSLATAFLWSFSGPLAWFLFAFSAMFMNFLSLLQLSMKT